MNGNFFSKASKLLKANKGWWLACLLWLAGCGADTGMVSFGGATMGTSYSVKVLGPGLSEQRLKPLVEAELLKLNQTFSTYLPDSEISRLNSSGVGKAIPISAEMRELLALSLKVSDLSGGGFDITVGPLVALWGFGAGADQARVPDPAVLAAALALAGADSLALGAQGLVKRKPVQLDMSALAKGYAVDRLAELLEAAGASDYLVEIGGELKAKGHKGNSRPWMVAIEKPLVGQRGIHRVLPLVDMGMATSGDYRNFFEQDGKRYSHTIDPRTGWPVPHQLASVTVLDASVARADALATAFMVLGLEETMKLAEAKQLAVLAIIRDDGFKEVLSSRMTRYLEDKSA